ncbi:MAG TPA: valine--tRNA ligase [Nitrospinota bacterium]|nr:valine--tRNA ligase [Nitrospinota bacterium]
MADLEKKYNPERVEKKWYQYGLEKKLFHADENSGKKAFSIVIPPPNITGSLHMGHALNSTLQDILIRWKKMDGFNTLWQPGTDHAGIATQNVVERQLMQEGLKRDELGREKFIKRVWQWKKESGSTITRQLMELGSACDWERERFTMDAGLSAAVREVFVTLYKEGLIYRKNYIINYCPRCNTALSDLEVEHQEIRGHLYHVGYPFLNGNGCLVIATTRPETMLGDTAVAVNPGDSRYEKIVGEKVMLPVIEREIPVIADKYVDMKFGTGALKITPAHDPNDFEIGLRHDLPQIKAMDNYGVMSKEAGKYEGMDRFECRKKLLDDLEQNNLLIKSEDYVHSIGHCYRCKTIIEPTISLQWFVRIKPLAEPAIRAVKEGKVKIIPKNWEKTYFDWMENIRDWCISRQIWWGHQIPAWYCVSCSNILVEKDTPEKCDKCEGTDLIQETDVLDTWFSSALWPFSTLGWPNKTKELEVFYPTSVMVTGFDILFFWVARMIMMGIKFMGDVPFKHVYIHALVRDAEGKKMSKSKGNIINPLEVMDRYGTDAFRFTLAAFAAHGRDIKLSEERIEGYRHFANKIWNASRFALMSIDTVDVLQKNNKSAPNFQLSLADRWILSRMNLAVKNVRKSLEEYRFNDAAEAIYQFLWHELCDWYIEIVKPRLYGKEPGKESAAEILMLTLGTSLRLLHPFMPFITEEIWERVKLLRVLPSGDSGSILLEPYPLLNKEMTDLQAEEEMKIVIDVVAAVRSLRGEMNIAPAKKIKLILKTGNKKIKKIIREQSRWITQLAGLQNFEFQEKGDKPEKAAATVVNDVELFVLMDDLINLEDEKTRLQKEIKKIREELDFIEKKLSNHNFINKAPAEVVNKNKNRQKDLKEKISKVLSFISDIER